MKTGVEAEEGRKVPRITEGVNHRKLQFSGLGSMHEIILKVKEKKKSILF